MKDKRTAFAWFTIPEYEKEEAWLREQHILGWALVGITFPGFYHFKKCVPEDVIYQLDYNQEGRQNRATYIQLFKDFKWEYITDFVGYSYFRKPVDDMVGSEEAIFSDDESKLEMARRVYKGRMIPMLIILFTLIIPQLVIQYASRYRFSFYVYIGLLIFYCLLFTQFGIQYWRLKQKSAR